MRFNNLRRIKNCEFRCPGADCGTVHNWPRCINRDDSSMLDPFSLLVCPECKLFIEIHSQSKYDFFVGCIHESLGFTLKVFRDYLEWVSEPVRATLEESLRCHQALDYNGCIALAREAVEVMATDLGGQGRSLFKQLEDLKDRGLIALRLWILEDSVRNLGNFAVHFDPNSNHNFGSSEADCALAYAYEVSKQIYLRRRIERFKIDMHKERYLEILNDLNWGERYGIHPLPVNSA